MSENLEESKVLDTKKENRFNLTNKLYQKTVWSFVEEYIKLQKCNSPIVVDLDLTTFCDLACPECISTPVLNTVSFKNNLLSVVDEIIEQGVKAVILIGGGEPLLHNDASKVIEMLGKANIKIGLVTNGTLINKHLDAIAEYVSWTRVSMDAGTKEIYDKFRPAKNNNSVFNKVIENMKALAEIKTGDLGYSYLLMTRYDKEKKSFESNYDDIEIAGKLAKEIGCDYFELKSMFDEEHKVITQSKELINKAKYQTNLLKKIQEETFKVYDAFTFSELIEEGNTLQKKDYTTCPVTELRTTITPHGVYPCAYHRNNSAMKIGDLNNSSLKEIWNNKEKIVNPSVECTFECARNGVNLEIFNLMNKSQIKSNVILKNDFDLFI